MARRSSGTGGKSDDGDVELVIDREAFDEELQRRISLGEELRDRPVTGLAGYQSLKADVQNWDEYNEKLIQKSFTTDGPAMLYRGHWPIYMHGPSDKQMYDDVLAFSTEQLRKLKSLRGQLILYSMAPAKSAVALRVEQKSPDRRSVFVVHGRNEQLRRSMFEFLRSINLRPMEWTEAVALTGEGSPYVGQVLDAAFANATAIVVLLTPDEVAYLQSRYGHGDHDLETDAAEQARPNVLFEAGMALGRDASRTVLVEVGALRPFSDVAGRHTIRLTNAVAMRQELAMRLQTAGCDVNLAGTDWHKTGDFSAPAAAGNGLVLGRRVPSQPRALRSIDFDVKYSNRGGNRLSRLQVINRGTETAFDVRLVVPDDSALELMDSDPIPKIPGGGKSVTIDVLDGNRQFGAGKSAAFDVSVTGNTASGETVTQSVFLDMNG